MSKGIPSIATPSANTGMKMSPSAHTQMRRREKEVFRYYDDMGSGKGNCTWRYGILAHKGPCSKEELARPVSAAAVEAEFARRVTQAEASVIRHVRKQSLSQQQFEAMASLTYNVGERGCRHVYTLADAGHPSEAAAEIRAMTWAHVHGEKVVARGLIARRADESAPFETEAKAAVVSKR